jgi:hypothetical protein
VHAHGERIHDLDMSQGREGRTAAQLELGIDQALEAELYRLGVEGLAVVEPDATSELELPGRLVHAPVRLGQERNEIEIGVPLEQSIEEVVRQHGGRRFLVVHGVERGRVDTLRDHHGTYGTAPSARDGLRGRCEGDKDEQPEP